jgi:hypothetical protein
MTCRASGLNTAVKFAGPNPVALTVMAPSEMIEAPATFNPKVNLSPSRSRCLEFGFASRMVN